MPKYMVYNFLGDLIHPAFYSPVTSKDIHRRFGVPEEYSKGQDGSIVLHYRDYNRLVVPLATNGRGLSHLSSVLRSSRLRSVFRESKPKDILGRFRR